MPAAPITRSGIAVVAARRERRTLTSQGFLKDGGARRDRECNRCDASPDVACSSRAKTPSAPCRRAVLRDAAGIPARIRPVRGRAIAALCYPVRASDSGAAGASPECSGDRRPRIQSRRASLACSPSKTPREADGCPRIGGSIQAIARQVTFKAADWNRFDRTGQFVTAGDIGKRVYWRRQIGGSADASAGIETCGHPAAVCSSKRAR